MTTNSFFNNYNNTNEQNLLDQLIIESIQQYGMDMIYLPRRNNNTDKLYGTSDIVHFDTTYPIEMYLKSFDGFNGDGDFMSKFGLEIRDQCTFYVSKTRFAAVIGSIEPELIRPREGDLIFFPLNKKCFEIKFADNKPTFYQLGALQGYNLTCELYEYSSEIFNTGIPEIDNIMEYSLDVQNWNITDESGNSLIDESGEQVVNENFEAAVVDDSEELKQESSVFVNFSTDNPFSED